MAEDDDFASQGSRVVHCGVLAYGSSAFAPDPRALQTAFSAVAEVGADTKFFSQLGNGPAEGKQINGLGLGLELGRLLLS